MSSVCDFYCCYQSKLQLDLVNANLEINSTTAPMRNRENKKKEDIKLSNIGVGSTMCSNCGNNSNKEANNLVLIQDVISIKSYLQKLRRILHDSEESSNVIKDESIKGSPSTIFDKISRENGRNKNTEDEINDLKKQVALLSQQNVEKDHQIESLYNQLDEFKFPAKIELEQKNGATQTERVKIFSVNSDSGSSNRSHSSSPAGSLNGEYRSNTAERCRLRRSRTPVSARTPPPSAVFMSPSPSWSSTLPSSINTARSVNVRGSDGVDSANGSTCGSPIYRCSEDGTLRIPIRSASAKPKTTSGYYTTNNKHFL